MGRSHGASPQGSTTLRSSAEIVGFETDEEFEAAEFALWVVPGACKPGQNHSQAPQERKEAPATQRGREPHKIERAELPPPQVALVRSSHAHFGRTSHHCRHRPSSALYLQTGCRVTEIAGRSRSRNAQVSSTRLIKESGGGTLSPDDARWFLHRRPPTKRKDIARKIQLLPWIISSPACRSRRFSSNCTAFWLILGDGMFRLRDVPTGGHDFRKLAVRKSAADRRTVPAVPS